LEIYVEVFDLAALLLKAFTPGVSNSNCSEGQMRTCRESPYDSDATMAEPKSYQKQLLHLISYERYHEL